jgi:threonine aldolase
VGETSDFRSDTVTRPTPEMRRAIAEAPVGDDVLDGDPTVRALEEHAADWLGKEGALFVPSGTMANQVALGVWTRPGDELVCEAEAHVVRWEAGATGFLHGVQTRLLRGERGALVPAEVRAAVQPVFIHSPATVLVCVEQTHMGAGGAVIPLERLRAIRAVAEEHDLPLHMDGARLANAAVASGIPAREHAATVDSVSLCLSKGLGAPVGSVIAGDAAFLERARRVRKRLGGWMRQAGLIAAGGLHALRHHVERLEEDPAAVETNLVMVRVGDPAPDAATLARELEARGVRVSALAEDVLRFVTHMDVGPADVERLGRALEAILRRAPGRG